LKGDQLSSSVMNDYTLSLKVFEEWLVKKKHVIISMEEIKLPKASQVIKTLDDMFMEEDIQKQNQGL